METLGLIQKIEEVYLSWGYGLIFFSSLVETSPIGFAIPGGLIVALGGFFAFGKSSTLTLVVISGSMGMLVTFIGAYILGKKTGFAVAKKLKQEKFAQQASLLLEKQGPVILTTSLLANLTRFWVAYVAGAQGYNILRFLFYATTASLTWNSLLVTIGYLAGSERSHLESGIAKLGILSWILVLFLIATISLKMKREFKKIQKQAV